MYNPYYVSGTILVLHIYINLVTPQQSYEVGTGINLYFTNESTRIEKD